MSALSILAPEAIKLLKQYMEKGKVERSTVKVSIDAALAAFKDMGHKDIRTIGMDIIAIGKCVVDISDNHKPSDGNIPPIDPNGAGLTDNR